jgi:hypothetical protein
MIDSDSSITPAPVCPWQSPKNKFKSTCCTSPLDPLATGRRNHVLLFFLGNFFSIEMGWVRDMVMLVMKGCVHVSGTDNTDKVNLCPISLCLIAICQNPYSHAEYPSFHFALLSYIRFSLDFHNIHPSHLLKEKCTHS